MSFLKKLFYRHNYSNITEEMAGSQNDSFGHSRYMKIPGILVLIDVQVNDIPTIQSCKFKSDNLKSTIQSLRVRVVINFFELSTFNF